jgi:hypothetical protein
VGGAPSPRPEPEPALGDLKPGPRGDAVANPAGGGAGSPPGIPAGIAAAAASCEGAGLSADDREEVHRTARDAVMQLPLAEVSTQALCTFLAAFSRAGYYDGALLGRLALGVLTRAERGEASIAHMASVLSSLANCNMVYETVIKGSQNGGYITVNINL